MTKKQMLLHLEEANRESLAALEKGHMPFGALLIAPDNETILLRQGNIDTVRHAENELARRASALYPEAYLWECTLVTTIEPCAMCAATQYWANIGRLVYGVSESDLKAMTGNHPDNPTMELPSRTVLAAGQKAIEVFGPFTEVAEAILEPHKTCWD
jgi:tRNA(Arg) A34 adenosine deaminase TadA